MGQHFLLWKYHIYSFSCLKIIYVIHGAKYHYKNIYILGISYTIHGDKHYFFLIYNIIYLCFIINSYQHLLTCIKCQFFFSFCVFHRGFFEITLSIGFGDDSYQYLHFGTISKFLKIYHMFPQQAKFSYLKISYVIHRAIIFVCENIICDTRQTIISYLKKTETKTLLQNK